MSIINHCFVDGEHYSSNLASKFREEYWRNLPLGSLIIQEFSDNTANIYYRIFETGVTNDDYCRIGDSAFNINHLPVSPAMRALFLLVKGQYT